MKKKAIEKIPFIGLKRISRKKDVEFVGVTATMEIAGEAHLFLEVYRNKRSEKEAPVVRIVLTEKDFGTWFVGRGEWSRGKIMGTTWDSHNLIWSEDDERIRKSDGFIARENVLNSKEDLKRIKEFCNGYRRSHLAQWEDEHWWEYIDERQRYICGEEQERRRSRIYARRQQALKERADNTPELPEDRILEYADRVIFREKHYLYYKKHGVRVRIACSKCGGVTERRWKPGISFESQFEQMVEEPREGSFGNCPMCGARGEWKPQGKMKDSYSKKAHVFLGQKYKKTGMVFRYIELEKKYLLGLLCEGKEKVMKNACEEVSGIEIARTYFEEGREPQTDFHKHDSFLGKDFWDDCNLYGMANITIWPAPILEETYEAMQGTLLQYSAMREYEMAEDAYINPTVYAAQYIKMPQIEMLTKLGLIKVVRRILKYSTGIVASEYGKRVDTFLGIRKEHIRQLIRYQGEESILDVMKLEKRLGQHWTDEQIEKLAEIGVETGEWTEVLKYMGIQKVLNLIGKYAGVEYGTGCCGAESRLRDVARTYFDYLNMRKALEYDMSNTIYQAPKDLNREHQKMVTEYNREKANLQLKEVNLKYPLIGKNYRRLRRKFCYEDENFCIRPARDAGEIVMEGRILHHCVGGDDYLRKHNDDITTILFLRTRKEPDVPYITVEIGTRNLELIQWYGANDKKTDKENMDRWLNAYVTRLKCGQIGEAEETEERILLRA